MKIKVNQDLILIKGFYFFFNGASAPVAPYLAVIAKSIGYSTTNIGAVLTAVPLLSLLTKPTIGSLADKFSIHKALFLMLMVVSGACMFSLQWFSYAPVDTSVLVGCEAGSMVLTVWRSDKLHDDCYRNKVINAINNSSVKCEISCYNRLRFDESNTSTETPSPPYFVELVFSKFQFQAIVLNITSVKDLYGAEKATFCSTTTEPFSCDLSCLNPELQELIIRPEIHEKDAPRHAQFWIFALLAVTWRLAVNNAYTFGDTICLNLLKDRPQDFGIQRTFGAAGWGLIGVLGGIMTDWYSQGKHTPDYTLGFYLGLMLNLICIFIALNLKYGQEKKTSGILSEVRNAVLGNPQFILFLVVVIFCGIYSGLVWNFLLWFVEDIYSGDQCDDGRWIKTLEGLIIFVHTWVGEIGFFAVSGWMVKRFGPANCISLVVFAFSLRFTLFYFIPNPWWLLAIEVLNGITYATYCVTAASYANQVAPAGTRATVQGITSGIFDVGLCLGIFFGGVFIDQWGGRLTFLFAGISAFILGIIYTGLRFCSSHVTPAKKQDPVS